MLQRLCRAQRAEGPVQTAEEQDKGAAAKDGQKAKRFASSWDAKEANAVEGEKEDYLSNLGTAQNYNINVSHGACTRAPCHQEVYQ